MRYIWLLIRHKIVLMMNSRMEGWSTDHCMHACNVWSLIYLHTYASEDIASLPLLQGHSQLFIKEWPTLIEQSDASKLLIVLLEYFLFDKARILAWHKYSFYYANAMFNAFRHLLRSPDYAGIIDGSHWTTMQWKCIWVQFYSKV